FVGGSLAAATAAVAQDQAPATIENDDPLPAISILDTSTTEGNSATKNLSFLVRLSTISGRTVNVDYTTLAGTASAGSDFVLGQGTVSFLPGQISKSLNVVVNGDTL